ncbi:MAG: hypothetical protein AAB263_12050 [Planctomycetota bacterium]
MRIQTTYAVPLKLAVFASALFFLSCSNRELANGEVIRFDVLLDKAIYKQTVDSAYIEKYATEIATNGPGRPFGPVLTVEAELMILDHKNYELERRLKLYWGRNVKSESISMFGLGGKDVYLSIKDPKGLWGRVLMSNINLSDMQNKVINIDPFREEGVVQILPVGSKEVGGK